MDNNLSIEEPSEKNQDLTRLKKKIEASLNNNEIDNTEEKTRKELEGFQKGSLAEDAEKAEHARSENLKNLVSKGVLAILYMLIGFILIGGLVWFWHLITPWDFLKPPAIDKIEGIGKFLAGIFVGYISRYIKIFDKKS